VDDYLEYFARESDEVNAQFDEYMEVLRGLQQKNLKGLKKEVRALHKVYRIEKKEYEKLKEELSMQRRAEKKAKKTVSALEEKADRLISSAMAAEDTQRALFKARVSFSSGAFEEALSFVSDAITSTADSSEAYTIKGTILHAKKDSAGAIAALEEALRYNPKNYEAMSELGIVHHDLKQFNDAVLFFRAAADVKPDTTTSNNLGTTFIHMGKVQDALEAFETAISLDSENSLAHRNKALLYLRLGDVAKSVVTLKQGLRFCPKDKQLKDVLKRAIVMRKERAN
jgi:tetratricopeptide (TPR) repeat protein